MTALLDPSTDPRVDPVARRIERLNTASTRRVLEPDDHLPWGTLGDGQVIADELPDTDPMLAALNRYHRQEEARHLSFARSVLPEAWDRAGPTQRAVVRHVAPGLIDQLWQMFVHPGVYATAGLPVWETWKA